MADNEFPECDLLPCPFCGAPAELMQTHYTAEVAAEEGWEQTVYHIAFCTNCAAMTADNPGAKTPEIAAAAWNRRSHCCHQ